MRKLLFNLHLYVALIAGVFVLILGLTGAIIAFEPELDHLIHPRLSYVTPGTHRLTLVELGEIVAKTFPGEAATAYSVSPAPDISAAVFTKRGQVMVNPYTGVVLGVRPRGPDLLDNIHQLHLRLLIRNKADTGKKIVSWAGVAMLFLLLSGLYLWWPLKRMSIGGAVSGRRWWFDLHNAVGFFSLLFLLMLTTTGLVIGFEETTVPLLFKVTGSAPSPQPKIPPPPPGASPIPPDRAMEIARQAIPGAFPFEINVPGPKGAYQVRSRFPEDLTGGGRSRVTVDQYTGQVLFAEGSRTAPAGARMVILNRALHTGDLFGIPSKAAMSLVCLMAVIQVASGVVMWLKQIRKRAPAPQAISRNNAG